MSNPINKDAVSAQMINVIGVCLVLALLAGAYKIQQDMHLDSLVEHGIVRMNKGDYRAAAVYFSDATKQHSGAGRAFYYLGMANIRLGNYVDAETALERAEQLGVPKANLATVQSILQLSLGKPDEALKYYESVPHDQAAPGLSELFAGIKEKNDGRFKEALAHFSKAVESGNTKIKAAALHERAFVLFREKELKKALADLDASLELQPTTLGYQHRADLERKLGQHKEAVADYTRAIEFTKTPGADLYIGRGRCLIFLKQYAEAGRDFRMALHLEPELPIAVEGLQTAHAALEREKEPLKKRSGREH